MLQSEAVRGKLPRKTFDSLQKFLVSSEAGSHRAIALIREAISDKVFSETMNPNSPLTLAEAAAMPEKERLRRIGHLLAKAIIIQEAKPRESPQSDPPGGTHIQTGVEQSDDERILNHVRLAPASPKEIRSALGFSRSTFNRRIAALKLAGKVVQRGNTRGTRYHPAT